MKPWNDQVTREAMEFSARWGFITRSLFFEFMCPKSRAQQFRDWSSLVDQGFFLRSKASPLVLILSKKGRMYFGSQARPARQATYIEHDELVARTFLALHKRGLIEQYWLEHELMKNPLDAHVVLGAARLDRVPDIVFDLKTADGFARCALEIERTVKSHSRYAKMALAYLGYSRVSLILFGCGAESTAMAIRRAFNDKVFTEKKRVPGLFQYERFSPQDLNTKVYFEDRELDFKELLSVVATLEVPPMTLLRDKHETVVSSKKIQKLEAA